MRSIIKNLNCEYSEKISALFNKHKSFAVSGITDFSKLYLLAGFVLKNGKKPVFIVESENIALKYQNDLKNLFDINCVIFPFKDGSIYDTNPDNLYKYAAQISVLFDNSDYDILIIPQKALFEKFPSRGFFEKHGIEVNVDDEINVEELVRKLVSLGYKRKTLVADISEFAVRGDIIDVFPPCDYPFRIELWGDTVTDIRMFDNSDQKSISKVSKVIIKPIYKFILEPDSYKLLENFVDSDNDYLKESVEDVKAGNYFEGISYYAPLFNDNLKTVPEFSDKNSLFVIDNYTQFKSSYEQYDLYLQKQYEDNIKSGMTLPLPESNHPNLQEFLTKIADFEKVYFDNFISEEFKIKIELNTAHIPFSSSGTLGVVEFIKEKLSQNYKVITASDYKNRVEEILKESEIPFSYNSQEQGTVFLTRNSVLTGSVIEDCKLVVITDKELFNKRSKAVTGRRYNYKRESLDFIESLNDIKEGDYVVHSVHGIGVFKGLSKQSIDGEEKDYFTIEYAKGDKLHMPAEQINLICRYRGSGNVLPPLSKMGGNDWTGTKNKVKKAVEEVAADLVNLYAVRKMSKGIAFEPDTPWQYEMEDSFEYTETPDQMKAIIETKEDMESDKPMDRLICGDVGFGKTEVALRAIFKAVMSSKQAALVVPTTILAMQHYRTISERFKPFPIKVEFLSRFKTSKEQKEVVNKLSTGEVDVIIGTHRLLQDDIGFKDLGLVVIDEEHKFGVRHKEKLKRLKKNTDILTMSATPIPRTLYMSLSGIKDMSIINTAPTDRLPVKTFVGEYKDNIVKNAVNYEIEREGQVFYLYNRVETIYDFAARLQQLLPHIRIAVAHGQIDKDKLEKIMEDFLNREYDLLLCTTIIESGLDIPNANTIIIHDADKFGLAQLYQIRGRVGRTDKQAFCYCLFKNALKLTPDAIKRLNYIKEFTSLGSGYQIAVRDIEIRGVGNVLGTKQHGQMINVGFDTYCSLLEDAVNEIKEGKIVKPVQTVTDINITAYIPDELVGSEEQKMIEYKRLADVKSISDLDEIKSEWKDRFSKLPESVENLIKLVHVRILASQVGISLIRQSDSVIRIYTNFSKGEWNIICAKADKNITKYIKYVQAPKSCTDGIGILLLSCSFLNFDELFNILSGLFYHILRTGYDYNNDLRVEGV